MKAEIYKKKKPTNIFVSDVHELDTFTDKEVEGDLDVLELVCLDLDGLVVLANSLAISGGNLNQVDEVNAIRKVGREVVDLHFASLELLVDPVHEGVGLDVDPCPVLRRHPVRADVARQAHGFPRLPRIRG